MEPTVFECGALVNETDIAMSSIVSELLDYLVFLWS